MAREFYTRGLDKGDEYEADLIGVVLAARSGYDPYGLPALLSRIDAIKARSNAPDLMFETQPPTRERLDRMTVPLVDYEDQSQLT